VINRIENAAPMAKKHIAVRVVAFATSTISVRLFESLRDLYGLQMQKMRWQMKSAKAAMTKFEIFVLIDRNCASETPPWF
jgi:hypothetical protein